MFSFKPVQRESWALAAFFLAAFCYLGLASAKFVVIYREFSLPVTTNLAVAYGTLGFPLLGVVASGTFICSSALSQSRWRQWIWIALFTFLAVYGFRAVFHLPLLH